MCFDEDKLIAEIEFTEEEVPDQALENPSGCDHIYEQGYDEGYREGNDAGYGAGYDDGYREGYDIGVSDGYDEGYEVGQADCPDCLEDEDVTDDQGC